MIRPRLPPVADTNLSSPGWQGFFRDILAKVSLPGTIAWNTLSFLGSNITDIVTRNHADLQNLNTASHTHLTSTNATDLTDGGDSTLHYHAADRARANHTGTQSADTITNGTSNKVLTAAAAIVLSNTSGTNTGDNVEVTAQAVGFTITKGATPKTLTVPLDASVSGTNTGDSATPAETTTTIGALIGSAADAVPNNTDFVATSLTAGGILKKITWTNVKAFLKTYFDTLYPSGSGTSTGANTGDQTSIVGITGTTTQFNTALSDGDFAIKSTQTRDRETVGNPAKGASAPTQVFLNNVSGWKFGVGDDIYFVTTLPHDWHPASNIQLFLHWYSPNTTAARYINWQIDWVAIAIGETILAPGTTGTSTTGDILLSTTADTFIETPIAAIVGSTLSADDHITLHITRIASVGTAPAAGDNPVMVHFEIDYTADTIAP